MNYISLVFSMRVPKLKKWYLSPSDQICFIDYKTFLGSGFALRVNTIRVVFGSSHTCGLGAGFGDLFLLFLPIASEDGCVDWYMEISFFKKFYPWEMFQDILTLIMKTDPYAGHLSHKRRSCRSWVFSFESLINHFVSLDILFSVSSCSVNILSYFLGHSYMFRWYT
jgi:hypothetical protein